jgi:hypothetical protein
MSGIRHIRGIRYPGNSAYVGGIPAQSSALVWLDGTLSGSEFVDKSGNGRNFTITNKDFTANYLPYKSAATISAPASDATLIAADVNNFLYDTGGTPNQIPVVSFFQNIDYEDIGFSRHVAQSVNGNGVETREPHVKDFVWYAAALTGADLTAANSYYGVPTEQTSNVKWVSKDGNDTTGTGTKALPWLTLTKAEASATNGDLIYVKSGIYDEVDFWQPRFDRDWTALGGVRVTSSGTTYVIINSLTNNVTITGFIIDAESNTTYCGFITGDTTFNKCLFTNVLTYTIYNSGNIVSISNSVFEGRFRFLKELESDTCLFNIDDDGAVETNGEDYTFTNCILNFDGVLGSLNGITLNNNSGATFKGCEMNFISCNVGIYRGTTGAGSGLTFEYCTIIQTNVNQAGIALDENAGTKVTVKYCTIYNNDTTHQVLRFAEQTEVDINNNFIFSDTINSIDIYTRLVATIVNITNNFIKANYTSGYAMSIGEEGTTAGDDLMTSITIERNLILGQKYYTPAATPAVHGIFVGFQGTTMSVKYNQVNGVGLGIVIKGSSTDMVNGIVQSNIITNSYAYGIHPKGVDNLKCYNNTLVENGREFFISENVGADPCDGLDLRNNIFENTSGYLYYFNDAGSYGGTHNIDYNNIYYTDKLAYDGSGDVDLSAWNTAGYDGNGETGDPLLTDFIPQSGSPAIGAGETLAAAYDDGLDASTNWGDASTLPVVVTKQQTAPWDIGAYVS